MTKTEFLAEFKEAAEVKFDQSIVSAHPAEIAQAVWHTLDQILPTEETILFGVNSFEGETQEKVIWHLVLSNHVLGLVAEQVQRSAIVVHQFHRRERLSAKLEFVFDQAYVNNRMTMILREAKLSLTGDKQPIEIKSFRNRVSANAVCHFMKVLLTA